MGAKMTKKMQEEFNSFIENIPKNLDYLKEILKTSREYREINLDYTLETIGKVESFYIDVLEGKQESDIDKFKIYNALLTYIGEAVIANANGNWDWCTVKSDKAFNSPMISNWGNKNYDRPCIMPKLWVDVLGEKGRRAEGKLKNMIASLQREMNE